MDSIKADLKEGNDVLTLTNVSLSKDLTINQGLGDNTTNLTTLNIGESLSIQGGSGMDSVAFAGSLAVGGKATLALGDGVAVFRKLLLSSPSAAL